MSSIFKNLFSIQADKRTRRKSELAQATGSEDRSQKTRRHSVPEPSSNKNVQAYLEPIHEVHPQTAF